METLATLAMDIDVRSADPAEAKLNSLKQTARELEEQAGRTSAATKALGSANATAAETSSRAAAGASKYSGALTEQATLLLRNAALQDQWAKEAERAAGAASRAKQAEADLERTLIERNASFRASALIEEAQAEERAAQTRADAREAAAAIERTLAERNASFRTAALIKEVADEKQAAAEQAQIAQREADLERTLAERNAALRASLLIQEAQERDRATSKAVKAAADKAAADDKASRQVEALTKRVDALRATMDPLAAVQVTLAQRTKLLDDALAKGAISADQHAAMLSKVTRVALDGVKGINTYAGGLKNGGQYATQFSYQLNDIVTGLISGQKPMQVLAQQGGQVAQIFQMASMEAGGFKAAVRGLTAEVLPLLATFGPWIAGLTAVGAGVYYLVGQHNKQEKALKDLNGELTKQRQELEQISPLILNSGHNADLASDGLKNFDTWLKNTNVSLAEQNRLLRENTLNKLNDQAMKAAEAYSKAQQAFNKVNKPGPVMASAGGMGGFSTVAPVQAKDPKDNPFYKEAAENLRIAKQSYDAINEYRNKAYLAPEAAFGSQAAGAGKAAKAVRDVTAATEEYSRTAAPIYEERLLKAANEVYPEAAAAAQAYTKQQQALKDASNDNIRSFEEQTKGAVRYSSKLEILAADLEDAANRSRNLAFDIEDVAYAINNNDWTSALAGLVRVLAQVQAAWNSAASAKDKYSAAASVAGAVGGAIGGTAGSAISGAAAGAQLGTMIAPGIGTAIGAVLGGLGGLFGGSSAKKKARQQAAAQAAAEEAQRQQTISDTAFSLDVALLRAQGKELEAVAKEREKELARLTALSPALAETQKQLYALDDAATAAAKAAEQAAAVETKRSSIQDQIDQLTLSSSDLLAKTRARERAEAVALDPSLGDLIDRLYGLQDAATATADAVAQAEAAATAASEAYREQARISAYLDDQASTKAAAAQSAYNDQLTAFAGAATTAAHALDGAIKSLTDFADSLKAELGLGTTGGGLEQAKRAFNTAVATGNYDAIPELGKAYQEALRSGASSRTEYLQGVAAIRQASLNSATSAKSDAYQSSLDRLVMGALFQGSNMGDFSGLDEIRRLKAAGLPAAATGGAFTVGGNGGLDNNLLSINGVPAAAVNQGERVFIEPAGRRASNDNSELAALRAEVAAARQENAALMRQLIDYAKTVARIATSTTPDGDSVQVRSAS